MQNRFFLTSKMMFLFLLTNVIAMAQNISHISLYFPHDIVIDSKSNLFVCGSYEGAIVKISPDGQATVFKPGPAHRYNSSQKLESISSYDAAGIAIDAEDNIYIADRSAGTIYKVSPDGKTTIVAGYNGHTVKDGPALVAAFKNPVFIAVDKRKNIYVTDEGGDERNNTEYGMIRKISADGNVSTLKDNSGIEFHFDAAGMICDDEGNLLVCDRVGRCIKKISTDGNVTIMGGLCGKRKYNPIYKEGDIQTAEFMEPWYITLDGKGAIYFSDIRLNRVIKIADKRVSTVAGSSKIDEGHGNIGGYSDAGYADGMAKKSLFNEPKGLAFDKNGNLYIVDCMNHCIRKLSTDGVVSTFYK